MDYYPKSTNTTKGIVLYSQLANGYSLIAGATGTGQTFVRGILGSLSGKR